MTPSALTPSSYNLFNTKNKIKILVSMVDDGEPLVLDHEDGEDADQAGPIIWNYYKVLCVQSKKGGAKNVTCPFCDTNFSGCSST